MRQDAMRCAGTLAGFVSATTPIDASKNSHLGLFRAALCASNCASNLPRETPCRSCGKLRRLVHDVTTLPVRGLRLIACGCEVPA